MVWHASPPHRLEAPAALSSPTSYRPQPRRRPRSGSGLAPRFVSIESAHVAGATDEATSVQQRRAHFSPQQATWPATPLRTCRTTWTLLVCSNGLHSATAGYKPGEKKSIQEYAMLDAQDESLRRWKESLGISSDAAGAFNPNAPKVCVLCLCSSRSTRSCSRAHNYQGAASASSSTAPGSSRSWPSRRSRSRRALSTRLSSNSRTCL